MSSPFRGRWSLLAFGFAFAFFSNFGQTPFVAVFGGALREEFALSNGAWGAAYSLATLASGLLIIRVGGLIDTIPLRRFAVGTVVGLSLASAMMAATPNIVWLAVAIFMLRFFGQGLMVHVAVTTMAREFDTARGRAVAIAGMGLPAGSALFPILGALAVTALGWRGGWVVCTIVCVVAVLPLAPVLLRSHSHEGGGARAPFATFRFLAQKEMLLALPALTCLGFVGTAIAFHQALIASSKGWPLTLFASGFAVFAAVTVVATLTSGWLVDRFGARRPALVFQLPMAIGTAVLALSDAPAAIFIYMAFAGMSAGAYSPVTTSLLAEAYGVERLGAIRATSIAVTVVSTAASPVLFGVLADTGLSVDFLLVALAFYTFAAAAMLFFSDLTKRRRTATP